MSLCRVISTLASQLELQVDNLQENHSIMIAVMKNMPFYLEEGDLAKWESDYRRALGDSEDESSRTYKAIDLIYELAGLNLFGKFEVLETKRLYKYVVSELKKLGIESSGDLDVSQW